jgi:hypothetical protein
MTDKINGRWHCCQRPLRLKLDVPCPKANLSDFGRLDYRIFPKVYPDHQTAVGLSPGVRLGGEASTRTWASVFLQQPSLPFTSAFASGLFRSGIRQFCYRSIAFPKDRFFVVASSPDKHKLSSIAESLNDSFSTYPQATSSAVDKLENNFLMHVHT